MTVVCLHVPLITPGITASFSTYTLSQLAGVLVRVENLIVKNGEIQGEAESDWMRGRHVLFADVKGLLVGFF